MLLYSLQECNPLELSHSTIRSGMVHSFHQPKLNQPKAHQNNPGPNPKKFPKRESLPSHFLLFMWPFFHFSCRGKSSSAMEHLSHVDPPPRGQLFTTIFPTDLLFAGFLRVFLGGADPMEDLNMILTNTLLGKLT